MRGLLDERKGTHGARLALAIALTIVLGACAPTITELSRQQHVAQVRVESQPPGATVLVDDRPRGTTPTTVSLDYTVLREQVTANDQWLGGLLGVVGSGVVGLAGVALIWLTSELRTVGSSGSDAAAGALYGYGGGAVVAGLVGLGISIYALATASRLRTRVEPGDGLDLGLLLPRGGGIARVRIKGEGSPPPYDKLQLLRFDAAARVWLTPGLPPALSLEMRTADNRAPFSGPAHGRPTPTQTPQKPPSQEEPGLERPTLAP